MITENTKNYYEILEVAPNANHHEVLLAYNKAKKMYSMSNKDLSNLFSNEEIQQLGFLIEEAFGVLSHQDFKQTYEKQLHAKSNSDIHLSLNDIKKPSEEKNSDGFKNKLQYQFSPNHLNQYKTSSHARYGIDENFELEICQQTQWTGSFLKKVREYKKISIEKMQEVTKVNPWYIKALEAMDYKNLPAAVFIRGYIVQIAKELGLNQKNVADSYMKIYKTSIES